MHAPTAPDSAGHDSAGHAADRPLRLVVMGTGPFAVPLFRRLRGTPHSIQAVVTRPDRVAPGRRPPPNPMREAAVAAGVPILDPESVNEPQTIDHLRGLAADLFVVCDYGQILSPEALRAASLGGINLHGSLLPRHRGAAPVQWAILAGDTTTGVSVIHMTPALDAGGVITSRSTPIGPRETAAELEARLAALGGPAVLDAIALLQAARAAGQPTVGVPQDPAGVTRAPRLSKADGIVDWSLPAPRIERMRRALEPWPRATTFLRRADRPHRLVLEDVAVAAVTPPAAAVAGTVLSADEGGIVVACGAGTAVVITRVVPEGKRSMSAGEFLRGNGIHPGTVLG